MKSKKIFLIITTIAIIGMSITAIKSFNPFSKSDWEDVGGKIKGGFEDLGEKIKDAFEKGVNFLGKTFNNAKDLIKEAFVKVKSCIAVVGLGTQWAAKRAAYETAKASLEAANELKNLDPRLLSLETAEATAKLALDAAQKSLDAAQKSAQAFGKVLQALSTVASKGINIKSISFEAYMSKLLESAKGPRITIDAVLFGQTIKKEMELDFSRPVDAAKTAIKELLKEIKGI